MQYYNIDRSSLVMDEPVIKTIFKKTKILFADYTASGRMSPIIDNYLTKHIYPYYSNTHSNAYCGIFMKNKIKECKEYLRKILHLRESQKIIFTGNGTTSAINHLVNSIDPTTYKNITIYYSTFEHYSNHIPWLELSKRHKNINIKCIPLNTDEVIDLEFLKQELKKKQDSINIITITACSNVTGIKTPIEEISKLRVQDKTFLFVDYACSAPYDKLDGHQVDVMFISPHKFIGGPGTPGLLIAEKSLFQHNSPVNPGGGCIKTYKKNKCKYTADLETRESAGTPNILGIIRLYFAFKLKEHYFDIITNNEHILTKLVYSKFNDFENKYPQFKIICFNKNNKTSRLPIISFIIDNMHYNYIVALLNDLFGIQTRGGISCCGILGEYIEQKWKVKGWTRISFHWLMTIKEVEYIINSVEFIILNGNKPEYTDKYTYNSEENLFYAK